MVSENFRAAMLMVVSMVFFAFEDMLIKLLSQNMAYAQALGLLGLAGGLVFWGALAARGGRLLTRDLLHPVVIIRNLAESLGSIAIVLALALSDLSSTAAIMQALPLGIVLGAAIFLNEPVGWRRWTAIVIGFCGVLLVIRPGLDGFTPVSLLALLAVIGFAVRDVSTRRIPATMPSLQLSASAFLAIFVASIAMGLFLDQPIVMPDLRQWLLVLACVAVSLVGYMMLVTATRMGEAAALAPFRYARLIFALILAYVVFDERPDALTLSGAAIIVGSGAYAMWREAVLRRRKLEQAGFPT